MRGVYLSMGGISDLEAKMHVSRFVVIRRCAVSCCVDLSGLLSMYVHMDTCMAGLADFFHMRSSPRAANQQVIDNQDVDE
jgi:hypothetical protein